MVNTVKFSQFASANLNTATNRVAGISSLSGGINTTSPATVTWTTATRPASPYNGLLGYNSTTDFYEYWNSAMNQWIQLTTGGGTVTPAQVQDNVFVSGTDTGTANAHVVALSPPIILGASVFYVIFTPAHTNTSLTPTLNVNGTGPLLIVLYGTNNLAVGDLDTSEVAICYYDPAQNQYVLTNPVVSSITLFGIQTSIYTSSDDSGVVNAYVGNYSSLNTSPVNDQILFINNLSATNTGASTFTAGSFPIIPIVSNATLSALIGGEMILGGSYILAYNSTLSAWVLLNPDMGGGSVTGAQVQQQTFVYYVDSGVANAYAFTPSPAPATLTDGLEFEFTATHTNTGASTVNIGLGANNIYYNGNTAIALAANAIVANGRYKISYSTTLTGWVLLNPSYSILSASVTAGSGGVNIPGVTATNIVSLALPSGLWETEGNVYALGSTSNMTQFYCWLSTASATQPDLALNAVAYPPAAGNIPQAGLVCPKLYITGPATVYLSTFIGISSGTVHASGNIHAKLVTN